MSTPWNPWQKTLAAGLAGLLVGALGLRVVESLTVDQVLAGQEKELKRLGEELRQRELALAEGQARLQDEAARLQSQSARAAELADQILQTQGTATERLKKVIATVKALKETWTPHAP